jgi:small-conductance mechanosensitive channel
MNDFIRNVMTQVKEMELSVRNLKEQVTVDLRNMEDQGHVLMSLMNEVKKIKVKIIPTTPKMKKKDQEQHLQHLTCTQDQEGEVCEE